MIGTDINQGTDVPGYDRNLDETINYTTMWYLLMWIWCLPVNK